MKKIDLLNFIRGEVSDSESKRILDWIDSNENNKSYFFELRNQWVLSTLPEEKLHEEEYSDISRVIKGVSKRRKIRHWFYAAAAVLAILLSLTPFLNSIISDEYHRDWITISNNLDTVMFICLPDGSKVGLNSNSEISYPQEFRETKRDVKVSGEAYFEVVKNPKAPMTVITPNKITVIVLGTTFLLNTNSNSSNFEVILIDGNIELSIPKAGASKQRKIAMNKGDRIRVCSDMSYIKDIVVDQDSRLSWVNSWFVFYNTKMGVVLKKLESYYNVKFKVRDQSIMDIFFSATIKGETLDDVLDMMKYSMGLNYRKINSVIEISY